MAIFSITAYVLNGIDVSYIPIVDETVIQANLLHDVEIKALKRAFLLYPDDILLGLQQVQLGGRTLASFIEQYYTTVQDLEAKAYSYPPAANHFIKIKQSVGDDTIVMADTRYNNTEIGITFFDAFGAVTVGTGNLGKVLVTGVSAMNEYESQLQNGVFYPQVPNSICIISSSVKELRVFDEDLDTNEIASYEVTIRQYN